MAEAVIEYRDEDTETVFRWHGGAYVDVGFYNEHDSFEASNVLNVWNDELDESVFESQVEIRKMAGAYVRRPFRSILEAFEDRCREALAYDSESEEA